MPAFLICGKRLDSADPSLARAAAIAHLRHERPRCLCIPAGVEMYVARARRGFALKRMPYTGSRHSPSCHSHSADSPVARIRSHASMASELSRHDSSMDVMAADVRHLGVLLRTLWHEAELTRWQPGFEGRRSWATVRRHLLSIAEMEDPEDEVLRRRLYVPEFFRVDDRDAIKARRLATWEPAREVTTGDGHAMFMIGEVKKLLPADRNFEMIVKHVPDQPFELSDRLYRWVSENLTVELNLWAVAEVRLIVLAGFCLPPSGKPLIECLSLMPVSLHWLPVEDLADLQRIQELVTSRKSFVLARPWRTSAYGAGAAVASPLLSPPAQGKPVFENSTGDVPLETS